MTEATAGWILRRHVGRRTLGDLAALLVASVWLVHGAFNKLLHGSTRHLSIVQSVPGLEGSVGAHVLMAVGCFEVIVALWVLSGWRPRLCATVQTIALLSMNVVELSVARHLLLWPAGLIPLNLVFLTVAWIAATSRREPWKLRARLRRHPIPIEAHFQECLTLTYALPASVLHPLLPPGLELETFNGYGFVAVALVQVDSLRPGGLPKAVGQDFFLAGYRVFTRFRTPDGHTLRGLRILRSDANRALMVAGGNLLTHYNYHRCRARIDASNRHITVAVVTADHAADLDITGDSLHPSLPAGSPFHSWRDARRFAGPLLLTFDYEAETHSIIAIKGMRTNWRPAPISVDVRRLSFFDQAPFLGSTAILAAAFRISDIEYRWERGVRYPLKSGTNARLGVIS